MPPSLLQRRLHFVVGKGGVGKTTIAAALALLLVRRGRRTLAVEMDAVGRLPTLLGGRGVGYVPTREEAGRPCWDAIVVDAPATGHSLQYLRMPQAAREAFGAGLVQREATKITGLLRDRQTTAVHIVTLAEETPVTETLETRTQLVEALGLPLGFVIANRVHRRRFSPAVLERLHAATASPAAERALLACVAERATEESGWASINEAHLGRLRAGIGSAPLVELPFLFVEEFDRSCVEQLARLLEAGVAADSHGAARGRARGSS